MIDFYEKINLPIECYINQEIPKSKFYNKDRIDEDDIEIFEKYVDKIVLKYALKYDILNIPKVKYNQQEYSEIEFIEIDINNHLSIYDVATIVGRNIPYPLVIIFKYKDRFKIGSYWVRENKITNYKNVVENIIFSGWFRINNYFGRIDDIIVEMNYLTVNKRNMLKLFSSFYNAIKRYKSSYISINDVLFAFSHIKGLPKKQNYILDKCINVSVDENTYLQTDVYKKRKMAKYKEKIENEKIMICKDDLYQLIHKYYNGRFIDFDDFLMRYAYAGKSKWDCAFFDGNVCINSYSNCYEKPCNCSEDCEQFRKYDRNKEKNITTNMKFLNYVIDNEVYNNTIENVVEYGDKIQLVELDSNENKSFVVKKNSKGELPAIPNICLGKEIEYEFEYENKKYKLINIIKNKI